jgi:hypothetical protein
MAFQISKSKYLRSESGQSVILVAMVIMSFLLFFGFAINTGVLVTAKISVQAAADAAAYAGAATQARQLNAISFLNYDMRRQHKKYVHRYAYMGNVSSPNFPNAGGGSGDYPYPKKYFEPSTKNPTSTNFGFPVVCVPLTGTAVASDACVFLNLPNTTNDANKLFAGGGLTAISQAFLKASGDISKLMNSNCAKQGALNLLIVNQWLFRGVLDSSSLDFFANTAGAEQIKKTVDFLTKGLGLYPRNIIHAMRIQTLEKMINEAAKSDVDQEQVLGWEKSPAAESHERTIQAFKSALSNLNNEVMDHQSVIMTELQKSNLVQLTPVKTSFTTFYQIANDNYVATAPTYCNTDIRGFPAPFVPVGFKKTGNPYYSVKVKAKAKLMFSPLKDGIELEAVASAKPFGSRIGPTNLSEDQFIKKIKPNTLNPTTNAFINDCTKEPILCNIPNLSIGNGKSFLSSDYLKTMHSSVAINGNTFVLDQNGGGIYQATSPMPEEIGKYNILPKPNGDASEFIDYSADAGANSKVYRFYAPIFDQKGGPGGLTESISNTFDAIFGKTGIAAAGGIDFQAMKDQLKKDLTNYVTDKLTKGGAETEHGETQTFASVELPLGPWTTVNPSPYWLTQDQEIKTSWGSSTSGKTIPRFGYSVKFVASRNLIQGGATIADDDAEDIQH